MARQRLSRSVRHNCSGAFVITLTLVALSGVLASCGTQARTAAPKAPTHERSTITTTSIFPDPGTGTGYLAPGSDPSVLPGPVLLADEGNNRLIVVDPQ